jgi:hypothetical protein
VHQQSLRMDRAALSSDLCRDGSAGRDQALQLVSKHSL